jgi:hypothetical protein
MVLNTAKAFNNLASAKHASKPVAVFVGGLLWRSADKCAVTIYLRNGASVLILLHVSRLSLHTNSGVTIVLVST